MKLAHILFVFICSTSLVASEEVCVSTEDTAAELAALIRIISRTSSPSLHDSTNTVSTSSSLDSLPAFPKSILKKSGQITAVTKKTVTFNDNLNKNDIFQKYLKLSDFHKEPSEQDAQNSRSLAEQALNASDMDIKRPNSPVPSLIFTGLKVTVTQASHSKNTEKNVNKSRKIAGEVPWTLDYILGTSPSRKNTAAQEADLSPIQETSDSESDSEEDAYSTNTKRTSSVPTWSLSIR